MDAATFDQLLDLEGLTFLLTDLVSEAVFITDAEGLVRYWNPSAERTYGWTILEAIGRPLVQLMPSVAEARDEDGGVRLRSRSSREVVVTDRSGRRFAARVTHTPLVRNGRPVGTATVLLDQTARVVAEASLKDADRRLRSIVSNAHDLVVLVDDQGIVIEALGGVQDLVGRTAAGLIGKRAIEVVHPDDLGAFRGPRPDPRATFGGSTTRHRFRLIGDGGPRWAEGRRIDLLDDPAVGAVVWNIRDVHDEVEAKDASRILEARLAELWTRVDSDPALHLLEERLKAVVAHAPVVLATYDTAGTIDYWGGRQAGRADGTLSLLGRNIFEVFATDEAALTATRIALAGGEADVEVRVSGVVWDVHHAPILDAESRSVVGGVFVGVDVTARTRAEDRIHASEARMQAVLRSTSDVIAISGLDGVLRYVSPSVARMLGYQERMLVGQSLGSLVVGEESREALDRARVRWLRAENASAEVQVRHASGATRLAELSGANLIDDPGVAGIVVTFHDITDRRLAEEAAAWAATHDELTGLPSRSWLMGRVQLADPGAGPTAAVILLNLDGFSLINATFGRHIGNRVLQAVAHRLVSVQGADEIVCRLGSDEFVVLCNRSSGLPKLLATAARFVSAMTKDILVLEEQGIWLSASAGVAPPRSDEDMSRLLREADAATRSAKAKGPGRTEVFGDWLEGVASRRLEVERGLRAAIPGGQMRLHYQPIVNMHSGVIKGVEALVRWMHPVDGLLPPGDFLPIAEQSRLIVDIGRWVLKVAFDQAAAWERAWPERRLSVAVNLSARHLLDPRLVEDVKAALDATGVTPARIRLEITETSVMAEADAAVRTLRLLKATGVRISIDDFGTGWSSLAYLKNLPVDELKIDQSFVNGLGVDAGDAVIVASVVGLAEALGLDIVAEGVETARQHDALVRHGVHQAQGYLWSVPLPADEMTLLLAEDVSYAGIAHQLEQPAATFTEPNADLLSMLAHELRNPLTVITGYAELLSDRREEVDPDVLVALSAIGRNARLAATMIQSISDLGRLDDGTLPLALATVDIAALVTGLVVDAQQTMSPLVTLDGPDEPILVYADDLRIRQIVWNLLTNAVKFGAADKPVVVRVFTDHDEATVEVVDAGPGIPVEDAARMFRKYSRLSGTASGTGLGLFLSHRLAEAHGGSLDYEAVPTGGSRFRFSMPSPTA